jgi:hypothetical protein
MEIDKEILAEYINDPNMLDLTYSIDIDDKIHYSYASKFKNYIYLSSISITDYMKLSRRKKLKQIRNAN